MHYKIQGEWLNISIDEAFPYTTLSDFLNAYYINPKKARTMLDDDVIYLDHQPLLTLQAPLPFNHQLRLHIFKKEKIDFLPEPLFELEVVYEDAFCLIVNKPPGYIVYGETKDCQGTLVNVVACYYKTHKIRAAVRPIHRLDKETSGLIFFSKSSFFQPYFDHLLAAKEISRKYLARVEGTFPWDDYECQLPIGKDRHTNNKYIAYKNGKPACTYFTCLERTDRQSLLRCELQTGRTHQIRVHLSTLGYPIINDAIYGKVSDDRPMALTADALSWIHPLTSEIMTVNIEKTL